MLGHYLVSAFIIATGASGGLAQQFSAGCGLQGTVLDAKGGPVAGLFVSAYSSGIDHGRREVGLAGTATTDSLGAYCMHTRIEGPVFVLAAQWFDFKEPHPAQRGLPPTWYPGVADFASAKPVTIGGTDARANFNLAAARTFNIDGVVTGLPIGIGKLQDWSETAEGIAVQNGVREIDGKEKRFTISGAAAGNWTFVFRAVENEGQISEARLRFAINGDIHGAVLAFSPLAHVAVELNGKPYRPEGGGEDFPVLLYRLDEARSGYHGLMDLSPGVYKLMVPVPVPTTPFQCVESFSPGDVQVSDGKLMISSQEYTKPMSITTGQHCAGLSIKLPAETPLTEPLSRGCDIGFQPPTRLRGCILLVPESLPFQPLTFAATERSASAFYPWPLSPGTYRVYGFTRFDGLEYESAAVLSRFVGRTVVLEPDKRTEITVDVLNDPR